jgi:hypothetical protein
MAQMRITFYKTGIKQLITKLRFGISEYLPEGKTGSFAGKFCILYSLNNLYNLDN